MRAPISIAIAITAGVLILLGYFFPVGPLNAMRVTMLQWVIILAAFTFIVGITNLLSVHWSRIKHRQSGSYNSFVLIASLIVTALIVGIFTPTGEWSQWIFNYIQLPIEASLVAILAVVLLFASVRLLRRRLNVLSVVFLVTAVIVLLGTAPLLFVGEISLLSDARNYIVQVFSVGGARGILLGVALGTIATGVRILIGSDRPYSG